MELREWLIILGLILLVVIVLDGIRRYRKQGEVPHLGDPADNEDGDVQEATNWDFPNGGARVVESERVAPPKSSSSMFERRGLKTRIPQANGRSDDAAGHGHEHHVSEKNDKEISPSSSAGSAPVEDHAHVQRSESSSDEPVREEAFSTDSGQHDLDVKHTAAEAAQESEETAESSAGNEEVHASEAIPTDSRTDESENEENVMAESPADSSDNAQNESSTSAPNEPEDSRSNEPEDSRSNEPEDVEKDNEAHHDDVGEQQHARSSFHSEEERVDDPRYEGLSEILLRRPMDGVARLQEAAAERREKRAVKREEARIRRLEERARRAEEKARKREEKEREAELLRQQQAEQQRREEEQRRLDQERQQQQERESRIDDDDPLFAPSHHDRTTSSDSDVPYLGAVDTYDERSYESQEPEPRRSSDESSSSREGYHETRSDESNERRNERSSERNWVRDLPEPTMKMHPIVERALRSRVRGEDAMDMLSDADELVILNVVANPGESFDGIELTRLFLACGLNFSEEGEMFHRFETEDPDSDLQFSVVNSIKPGLFPMLDMETFSTRRVSFLLPLPSAQDPSSAFEAMLATANVMVKNLHGELRDENQSVMTTQTVEFLRQRVHEFERRMHLYRNSR